MHFSIPFVEDVVEDNSKKYQVYKVYINGVHYCTPRYSQFLQLYDSLKQEALTHDKDIQMPAFPPKRLLQLTAPQLEERRQLLEKFLQGVGSHTKLLSSSTFTEFLSSTHEAMMDIEVEPIELEVFLMSGCKITLAVDNNSRTATVVKTLISNIHLDAAFSDYFTLFLVKKGEDDFIIVRPFQSFEAPYLSLQDAQSTGIKHRIVLRKSFWSPHEEDDLLNHAVPLDLLYIQSLSDMDRGWIENSNGTRRQQLERLRQKGSKREYVQLCRTLRFYNYLHINGCFTEQSSQVTPVHVVIGAEDLVLRYPDNNDVEISYSVVRIKTWRVTTVCVRQQCTMSSISGSTITSSSTSQLDTTNTTKHELAFEYLNENGEMQWIRILSFTSEQIILMSMSLQSVVNEILRRRRGVSLMRVSNSISETVKTERKSEMIRRASVQQGAIGDADL